MRRAWGMAALVVAGGLVAGGDARAQATDVPALDKKLVEHGIPPRDPVWVAEHIDQVEARPFDGMMLRIDEISRVFMGERFEEADAPEQFAALERIPWQRFTDNFMIIYAASAMDWFSDSDWETVVHNVRLNAKAARLARCVGICFDPEPYGANPWHYPSQAHAAERSFDEYEETVRRRGAQFIDAVEAEMDAPVIHTFFLLSYFRDLLYAPDPAERERRLSEHYYGLLAAFLNGMLDAADPDTVIADGNEASYYYVTDTNFLEGYWLMKQAALTLVAPENRAKYLTQVQASHALYVDHIFDMRMEKFESHLLSPEERARYFEHNTYWAMRTSDRYVWVYTEGASWYANDPLPPGIEEAIIGARATLAAGERSEIWMRDLVLAARAELAKLPATRQIREATVARLAAPPAIDGALGGGEWDQATELAEFLPPIMWNRELVGSTTGWVTWDDANLYVAARCGEPTMQYLKTTGEARDDDVFWGETLEVFVAARDDAPIAHFVVNPDGVIWDGQHPREDLQKADTSWDPAWTAAATRGEDHWAAEVAIPWATLGVTPAAGTELRANVCRQRTPGRNEISAWSQVTWGFVEPESFGTWRLE